MPVARARAAMVAGAAIAAAALAGKVLAVGRVPAGGFFAWLRLPCDDVLLACGVTLVLWRAPRGCSVVVALLAVVHAAANAVLVGALGSPFVATMLRGVDGAMGDSVLAYLAPRHVWPALVVGCAAWIGVVTGRRLPLSWQKVACIAACAALFGALLPTPGKAAHRNPWFAFLRSCLPRAMPAASTVGPVAPVVDPGNPLRVHVGTARGRDVVFVVLESAAARFCDPSAAPPHAMPFLAALANGGLSCSEAWAVYPESIEGQVALLCGLPPMPDAEPHDHAAHAQHALPRRLQPHGYTSGLFHAGRFRFLGMQDVLTPMGFDHLADAATIGGDRESSFGIDEEATTDALLRWVDGLPPDQRFLACWLPIAGHHPYASPAGGPFPTDTLLGCYRNALHYADRSLRRLWQGLCARRGATNLLLCVVGDHGQAFGEHAGNFGHSFELYEENLRVPLVFVAPGTELRALRGPMPCTHLDVVPTLLDLLGLLDPVAAPSLLRRGTAPVFAFTDWGELLVAARDGRWKLVHEVQTGRDRLFDLVADPEERVDLGSQRPAVVAPLRSAALGFLAAARSALPLR